MISQKPFLPLFGSREEAAFPCFFFSEPLLNQSFLPPYALYILIIFITLCDNTLSRETHIDH